MIDEFRFSDYTEEYSNLVSFGSNQYHTRHRWYSFVEGYSTEFVRRIIGEQKVIPESCLDPFGGIGTTALTCQDFGIKCHSVESNPFFFNTARAKLKEYDSKKFSNKIQEFETYLRSCKYRRKLPELESKTFFQSDSKSKWIFHRPVSNAISDILERINELKRECSDIAQLFEIALANILVPYSNVYRNGKCLSYRKEWQSRKFTRKEIHYKFLSICQTILIDIRSSEARVYTVENFSTSYNDDVRKKISSFEDDFFDMVITSPPYLNSRDYTDVYRLELWILGYVKTFDFEKEIRKSALTSHVQIKLPNTSFPDIPEIHEYLNHLASLNGDLWNPNIPNMIKGYFNDMDSLMSNMRRKIKDGGKLYINVSNSSYARKVCNVDTILAKIASINGFDVEEIRVARYLNSSSQQKVENPIRESVIVLKKKFINVFNKV